MSTSSNTFFKKELSRLNTEQQKAVYQTEGPVMVIAGPGTGKTQILAARIGNILSKHDISPNNILCLTYTDAGAVAMRSRLLKFIGPIAYDIHIFTFHAFCNHVIKSNADHFHEFSNYDLISDLEKRQVFRNIIDELPINNPLKKLSGSVYFYIPLISSVIDDMKKENWTADDFANAIAEYLSEISTDPKYGFLYKRKYKEFKAGDVKPKAFEKEKKNKERLLACAQLKDVYTQKIAKIARFDYQDMLIWVHNAFKADSSLLRFYQEKYQYILVDEFQDTSGIQNEILRDLSAYWKSPNVFVVGDDDQSIYKFQGANINNIINFNSRYQPGIELVVLKENYRSSPSILSTAYSLIDQNEERLSNQIADLDKNLSASGEEKDNIKKPVVLAYPNQTQEEIGVVLGIKKLLNQGVSGKDIAILFRNHKDVENIAHIFRKSGITYNQKKKVNILTEAFALQLIRIIEFLLVEKRNPGKKEDSLFEILHYPFFHLHSKDISKITYVKSRLRNKIWLDLLGDDVFLDELNLENKDGFKNFHDSVYTLITASSTLTIQIFFELVLQEFGILDHILSDDERGWKLEILRTIFDFIKEEHNKDPNLSISSFLEMIQVMVEENVSLPVQRIFKSEDGINLSTAHGAKGLEFDHVFIIKGNESNWEKKRGGSNRPSYPFTLLQADEGNKDEEERRLFYVAITRAKKSLIMTYAEKNDKNKDLSPSRFISEILAEAPQVDHIHSSLDTPILEEMMIKFYQKSQIHKSGFVDHEIAEEVLVKFKMNPTALNKYLRCPTSFYFENILRVPSARTDSMGFGNAIHYTLEKYFNFFSGHKITLDKERLLAYFEAGMDKFRSHFTQLEWDRRISLGHNILVPYVESKLSNWNTYTAHKTEYPITHVHLEEVPLSGNLDRVSFKDKVAEVIDYKTGKAKNDAVKGPSDKNPEGSEYWRQLIFYKILLEIDSSQRWEVLKGSIDFIQPNDSSQIISIDAYYQEEKINIVKDLIKETYKKIKNHEFTEGCQKEECKWCNFVKEYFPN